MISYLVRIETTLYHSGIFNNETVNTVIKESLIAYCQLFSGEEDKTNNLKRREGTVVINHMSVELWTLNLLLVNFAVLALHSKLSVIYTNSVQQGGKRLGDETKASEQKGVMR